MKIDNNMGEDAFEKRKEKILNWFKNPYNLAFFGIIVVAFAIRLYYFKLTLDQAVWWDEGEYMLRVKHLVLDTPQSGFFKGRELFTPYFWALIYYFFRSETPIRFIQVIISTLTVGATYLLAKEVYSKKVGLLAAAFMTFFWLHLFFTARLLTYLYAPLFYTLALALFWKGYNSKEKKDEKYLLLFFLTVFLGIGVYYSIGFAALTVILYLLTTKRFSFIVDKKLWKYCLIAAPALLVSFIPSYIVQGSIIPRLSQVGEIEQSQTGAGLAGLWTYINMMPRLMLGIYLVVAILSLILVLRIGLFIDLLVKKEEITSIKKDLFIFLTAFVPFAMYTWLSMTAGGEAGASYDAWILPVFPALFALMAAFLFEVKDKWIGLYVTNKQVIKIVSIIVLLVLLFGFYNHLKFADETIKNKLPSYYNLKPAGEWIKQNSEPGDIIISSAVPELTYYSEREIRHYNDVKEDFLKEINESNPKYLVLTLWERSPEWAYNLPGEADLNLTVVNAFFMDENKQQPDVVIYKLNR